LAVFPAANEIIFQTYGGQSWTQGTTQRNF
jgi:hypothetical protein